MFRLDVPRSDPWFRAASRAAEAVCRPSDPRLEPVPGAVALLCTVPSDLALGVLVHTHTTPSTLPVTNQSVSASDAVTVAVAVAAVAGMAVCGACAERGDGLCFIRSKWP